MPSDLPQHTIVMADDDGEDCQLVRDALQAAGRPESLYCVRNGEDLFDYLHHRGAYQAQAAAPPPDLILLDLKMPRKDGRETLVELKADPRWRTIPVIALTTSASDADVNFCYDAGVNAYVTKPSTFRGLVGLMDRITRHWFEVAEIPSKKCHGGKSR